MAGTVAVSPTSSQDINGLLWGLSWDSLSLSYSFPARASLYGYVYGQGEPQSDFSPLNPDQQTVVRQVFSMVASVTNMTFSEVVEAETSPGVLRFAQSSSPSTAWAYMPNHAYEEGGDVWYGASVGRFQKPVPGGYGFYVFIHETLHALGLKHGHEADGYGSMTPGHDSMEYSIMTYRSYVGAAGHYLENELWGYAQSLMMYDIAALQHMYGADFSTNGGNTVYQWSPATGETFIDGVGQGTPGGNRVFMTIWDGGGADTYDFSNYTTGVRVDLRPGEWSLTSTQQIVRLGFDQNARGNIANSLLYQDDLRSLIENAIGGGGKDVILGNSIANTIKGGRGADRLNGLEGKDTLVGGAGKDSFLFTTTPSKSGNMDRILDFSVKDDTIRLDNAVFTKLRKEGKLAASAFWIGAKAHDATDRIIYHKSKGLLYYDADGSGKKAPVVFGQVSKGLKLTAADFFII